MMDTGRWPLTAATVLEKEAWRESLTSLVGMRSIRRKEGLDCWKGKGNPYKLRPPQGIRCPLAYSVQMSWGAPAYGKPQAFPQSHSC